MNINRLKRGVTSSGIDKWCTKHHRYYVFVCPPCLDEKREAQ